MTHICVSKLTTIGSDNGSSPGRRQAIIWTNAGILLIGPMGTNFSEILIETYTFSFKKMHLTMSSVKWRPLCLGLNVLRYADDVISIIRIPTPGNISHIAMFSKVMFKFHNNIWIEFIYRVPLIWVAPDPRTVLFLVSSCSCLCPSIEARSYVENGDLKPVGAAPTTSGWSTIALSLEVLLV